MKEEFGLVALESCPDEFYEEYGVLEESSYWHVAHERIASCSWGLSKTRIAHTSAHLYSNSVSGLQALAFEKKKSSQVLFCTLKKIGLFSIMYL